MDIVERLRRDAGIVGAGPFATMHEAAAEIVRLRDELAARDAPTGTAIAYALAADEYAKKSVNKVLTEAAAAERGAIVNWLLSGGFVRDFDKPWREQLIEEINAGAYRPQVKP